MTFSDSFDTKSFSSNSSCEEEELEIQPQLDGPAELNTQVHPHYVEIMADKLTAKYIGVGNHQMDFGSVRSHQGLPPGTFIYYYEIKILNAGKRSEIGLGFARVSFPLTHQIGSQPKSYGYFATSGFKRCHGSREKPYGPSYGTGDIVGCGINFHSNEIFYTKNGQNLGTAFYRVSGEFFPTLSLHSNGELIEANFGGLEFQYDIEKLRSEEREKSNEMVAATSLGDKICHPLIRDYLLQNGYYDTLKVLQTKHGWNLEEEKHDKKWESVEIRHQIITSIVSGNIENALNSISTFSDGKLIENHKMMFALHCQQFIEFIHLKKINEAVHFARSVLVKCKVWTDVDQSELENVMALLAYQDVSNSPVAYLLKREQREKVADLVNSAILEHLGVPVFSSLSILLKQLLSVDKVLREENYEMGEHISLEIE